MGRRVSSWVSLAALVKKDLVEEFRTRYALNSLLMFSIISLVVVSFSVGAGVLPAELHAALLWIVLFFTAMSGMGRSFIKEEEKSTGVALRMAVSPDIVFFGKLIFNAMVMVVVSTLVLFLYVVFMSPGSANYLLLATVVLLGTLGMAGASTILAAIVARAANQGTLLPILSLPVVMPLLMVAIQASRDALDGVGFGAALGNLGFLLSYGVVIVTVSLLLFEHVWS